MKNILFSLTFLLITCEASFSQVLDPELLADMKARSIGPAGMSGRVTAIAVEPGNKTVFYVGTASGGIWKTTNGGVNFNPIFDKEDVVGIGAMAIDPGNPDIVWVGTGEGNPRNSVTGGYGLYRSLDAGRTWEFMGLGETRHIHRVIVHPSNSNIVYVGATGSPWGPHKERGVYKTIDGGKNWEQLLFTNEYSGVADMLLDPRNPEKLYVAMWEHHREPWFFKSGGQGSGLYISVDGGSTWKKIEAVDGFPEGELGRIGLAVSASNPLFVYAIIEAKENAIYRSEDGGYSWKKRGTENIGNRPFYYAEIYVDPQNENRVYSLFSNVNVSQDGGKSFTTLVGRNIHSDHHAWWIHPDDPDFMIDGNDGGLAISYDRGKNWRHVSNLPVSQFYHISVDNELPYNVYGGMQDNGSWKGPAYVWAGGGIINEYWDFLMGGDGFDVVTVPGDARYCYAMSQGGNLRRIDTRTGKSFNIKPAEGKTKLRWHWNAALAQDPFQPNTIYYGSQFVHKSVNRGDQWETISPDLTTNDTSRQKFNESGGLTYDVTGAETYTCILSIAPSPLKEGMIWVGTDDGNVQLTRDGGSTWINTSQNIKKFPDRPWIPQVIPSNYKEGAAFVVVNNYRQNDYAPYLYYTEDYGKSWTRLVEEGDVPGYILSFVQDPVEPKLMFLGTEFGLYVSINNGEDWTKWTNGIPTVSAMDLALQEREADLVIGTFGRSAYVIDNIRPLREWARMGEAFTDQTIKVLEAPEAFMVSQKNQPGYYFTGDAYFTGQNRTTAARISYYVKEGASKEEAEQGKRTTKDTATIKILDAGTGKTVRTLIRIPQKGINSAHWYYDKDWIKLDFGRSRNSTAKYPGGGGYALPGDYKVRIEYKGDSSETMLTVKPDPRLEYDLEANMERVAYVDQVLDELEEFNESVKKINKCRTSLATIKKLSEEHESDTLKNALKELDKKLLEFEEALNGKHDVKGIYQDEENFYYKISAVRSSTGISGVITPNQKQKIEKSRKELQKMKARLENFLDTEWEAFKALVIDEELQLFN